MRRSGRAANLDNHPNPFNPATEVRCVLPARAQPAYFSLKIYNMRGQLIRTLARGETGLKATEHRFVWNGKDEQGHNTDAGVYSYCLSIGGKTAASGLMIMAK
jgi:flagellar hook assembly protein FlgD